MKKPSLLDRLTGGSNQEFDDFFDDEAQTQQQETHAASTPQARTPLRAIGETQWTEPEESEELPVDVYQTTGFVVIKALISGIVPSNLDISITRDMVTISGTREDEKETTEDNYFQRELYWGSFTRTVLLPEEVDVDQAEAYEKHGVLVIRLPKINKAKQMKLKVRSK